MTNSSQPVPPTNTAATIADKIISGANSAGVQVVEKLILADVAWLNIPPLKQILSFLLGWLDGYLSKAEQLGATFIIIDTQISVEEKNFKDALAALKAAQASGDKNAIAKALATFQLAAQHLGTSDGSATPTK